MAVFVFEGENYENASALVIAFAMNNFQQNDTFMKMALAWEQQFIQILKEYKGEHIDVSFMAEVSVRDIFMTGSGLPVSGTTFHK